MKHTSASKFSCALAEPARYALLAIVTFGMAPPVAAGALTGRVTGPLGQPVAGAIVAVTPSSVQRGADGTVVRHVVLSDRAGKFRLNDLPADVYGSTATFPDLGSAFTGGLAVPVEGELVAPVLQLKDVASNVHGALHSASPLPPKVFIVAARLSDDTGDVFYGDVRDRSYVISLGPGKYVVVAKTAGWESLPQEINIPGDHSKMDLMLYREVGAKPHLAQELVAMEKLDQEVRSPTSGDEERRSVDAAHEVRLKQIMREHGWPGADMVGLKATHAMWVLVQHASPKLLKQCLPFMKQAAERKELSWSTVALSIDRDLVHDGKRQLYGSQFMHPIEDEANLDARRRQVGLGPYAAYKALMLEQAGSSPARQ